MTAATTIQLRRDTAADWTAANPVLAQGEAGIETDTGRAKLGNGFTPWNTLAYWDPAQVAAAVAAEKTRALAAEGTNATAVTVETTRAESAEALLAPLLLSGQITVREPLPAENVIFVSAAASASDSNDGLTVYTAKATVPAAITALGNSPGVVKIGAGTFVDTIGIAPPANVSIEGVSSSVTIIDSRVPAASISGSNAAGWYLQHFTGFTITHANNPNAGVQFITHSAGIAQCRFDDLHLLASATASSHGITIIDGTGGNTGDGNILSNIRVESLTSSVISGIGINLAGAGMNASVNSNILIGCCTNDYATGVYIQGQCNLLLKHTFNGCTTAALHVQGDSFTYDNMALACYFDGSDATQVLLDDTANTSVHHMLTILGCLGVNYPSAVTPGTNPAMISFAMHGRRVVLGGTTPASLNGVESQTVYGGPATGLVSYMGDQTFTSGRIIAAGSSFAGSVNAVSNNGGISAAIQNNSSSAFRVVSTSSGTSFSILAQFDYLGNLTLPAGGKIAAAALPAATAAAQGALQLAGDLGGTSALPTLAKIQGTVIAAPPGGTTQFLAGNGTWTVPASSFSSGQYLCAPFVYAPAALATLSIASNTLTPFTPAATTVAAGSNGGEISQVATWSSPSAGVLDVATTTGWPAAGTVTVATSTTTATVTYTGVTAGQLTGCAYVSGSAAGTVATGGAVTLTSSAFYTGTFTAPASGEVIVTVSCVAATGTAAIIYSFALAAHGTVSPVAGYANSYEDSSTSTHPAKCMRFPVTGLTPGNSYNFDLLGAMASSDTLSVSCFGNTSVTPTGGGQGGPVVITVQAV